MQNQNTVLLKIITNSWNSNIAIATNLLDELTDEQLAQEVAPSKNTGIYLLGHLIAVHDDLFRILGLGERLYPELDEVFIDIPDKSGLPKPSIPQLRKAWKEVHTLLTSKLAALTIEQWFEKHTSISAEDFIKELHRNRMNVILHRVNHLNYHLGQMALLKK